MNNLDTRSAPDLGDLISALEDANEAFQALGEMIVTGIESGHLMEKISHGVWVLFRQQGEDVRGITEQLRTLKLQRAPEAVSTKRLPDSVDSASVIASNKELVEELRALRNDKDALRKEIIAEQLQDVFDAGEIAEAVNLKPETVQRVIDQLLTASRDTSNHHPAPRAAGF